MRLGLSFVFAVGLLAVGNVKADTDQAARDFHDLFRSVLPVEKQAPEKLARLHMLPDSNILAAAEAGTAAEALDIVAKSNLKGLIDHTLQTQSTASALDAEAILRKTPLTLVVVPGIFGEFIDTRGFEDVLMKPSKDREDFQGKVKAAAAVRDPSAFSLQYSPKTLGNETVPLSDVVNVGSITDQEGQTLVKVVLLYTKFMSLESLQDAETQAKLFNDRLTKYLSLTGPQDLAFVGYSRGTVVALEMLAQAKASASPYLQSTKGLISLGGVVWGSALADDLTRKDAPIRELLETAKILRKDVDPESRTNTYWAWFQFGKKVFQLAPKLKNKPNAPKEADLINPQVPTSLDRRSLFNLLTLAWRDFGLMHFHSDHHDNVLRFRKFFDAVLSGVESLMTEAREKWWATHELPQNVTYYAITAAMANPEASVFEKELFDGPLGYSSRSYDDLWLLQNRLDYEGAAKISLNDSQVSVPQAMFLPNAIANLSRANTGLKTQMLGTVGTHHWGLALRVVNVMKNGRTNPFPREALLKALAAKVALDH